MSVEQRHCQPRANTDRAAKLRWMGQAHLEPGMNLSKMKYLMEQYGLTGAIDWNQVADDTLDQMIVEVHHLAQTKIEDLPSASGAYAWEPFLGENDNTETAPK